MYYEEQWINGELYKRHHPEGTWIRFTGEDYKRRVKQLSEKLNTATENSRRKIEELEKERDFWFNQMNDNYPDHTQEILYRKGIFESVNDC